MGGQVRILGSDCHLSIAYYPSPFSRSREASGGASRFKRISGWCFRGLRPQIDVPSLRMPRIEKQSPSQGCPRTKETIPKQIAAAPMIKPDLNRTAQ